MPNTPDFNNAVSFLNDLKFKTIIGFITFLMVTYSFFGNIYRIPIQLEHQSAQIANNKARVEVSLDRIIELEKNIAVREQSFVELVRTRNRLEAVELTLSRQGGLQNQIERLEKSMAYTATRLAELNANIVNLEKRIAEK